MILPLQTKITASLALVAFLTTFALPANALTYEAQVIELMKTYELPNYGFAETGIAIPEASPITKKSIAPKKDSYILEGQASFYSRAGCLGCNPLRIMANGQPLNDDALTMAIGADLKHLVGYQAKVTSLVTGKSAIVKITDTGGFYKAKYGNRVADLTIATKNAIGMAGGVGQVRVEVLI